MKSIIHKIKLLKQKESHDCVQTGAAQILDFYKIKKSIEEIKLEVPVYINSSGKPVGSSVGHMASYFMDLGLKTTLHTSDVQLFDISWRKFNSSQLIKNLNLRKKYLRHPQYNQETINVVVDGFTSFLKKNGIVKNVVVDEEYIYSLLTKGPVYAAIDYQFLFDASKFFYNSKTKKLEKNAIKGLANTHIVIISGYKKGNFLIIDPDSGKEKWVSTGKLLGAYYLADLDLDSILITLQ